MELKVHCPHCHATLMVPLTAAGQAARCPACHTAFNIPTEEEIAEQTASAWIDQDLEEMASEDDQYWQGRLKEETDRKIHDEEIKRKETAREIEKVLASDQPALTTEATPPAPKTQPTSAKPATQTFDPVISRSQAQPVPLRKHYSGGDYPKEFLVTHPRPYLVVTECTQSGVTLSFDARFLADMGFRLSMPVMCAFTGETDRTLLQARPLAFLDQSNGVLKNAYELEAGHEQKLIKGQSRKEMIARMGVLEDLAEPFRYPFPYYLRQDHSSHSLKCYTTKHKDGSTLAHVLMPEGPFAIRWLAQVNGVCGPEYDLLRQDVNRLWQDVWLALDEQIRRRLEVWTNFQPGEKFRYFINDADMRKKDEGLAGVVLTDRRLIYKKFHRQGQFEYGTNARLVVRPDGQFAGLRVKTEDGTFKCAKFHFSDLEKLRDAAKNLGFALDISK